MILPVFFLLTTISAEKASTQAKVFRLVITMHAAFLTYSGAPLLRKFGNLSIREILVVTSAYVRPSVQTLEEGERSRKTTRPGVENAIFSWGESRGAFGQLAFFLAGNRMTTVTFEKEVFLKLTLRAVVPSEREDEEPLQATI